MFCSQSEGKPPRPLFKISATPRGHLVGPAPLQNDLKEAMTCLEFLSMSLERAFWVPKPCLWGKIRLICSAAMKCSYFAVWGWGVGVRAGHQAGLKVGTKTKQYTQAIWRDYPRDRWVHICCLFVLLGPSLVWKEERIDKLSTENLGTVLWKAVHAFTCLLFSFTSKDLLQNHRPPPQKLLRSVPKNIMEFFLPKLPEKQ